MSCFENTIAALMVGPLEPLEELYDLYLDGRRHHGEIEWYQWRPVDFRLPSGNCEIVTIAFVGGPTGLEMHLVSAVPPPREHMPDGKLGVGPEGQLAIFKVAYPASAGGGWHVVTV